MNNTNETKIERLVNKVRTIEKKIVEELKKQFPKDSRALAILRHGQIRPSPCTVLGVYFDRFPYVTVQLDSFKEWGRKRGIFRLSPEKVTITQR